MKKYILVIMVLLFTISAKAQSFKVIVNSSNSISSLTKAEVSNFFLKKKVKWANGTEVSPVDLSTKSATREVFTSNVLGKTITQVRSYWQQSVFSGKATPPAELDNDNKVIEFVKANSGAIGYVSSGASTGGVKVITVN